MNPNQKTTESGARTCETCGNSYDRLLRIEVDGRVHEFDCFECAIQKLAPSCEHCGVRIIGHGVGAGDRVFCCAHCARAEGVTGIADKVELPRQAA